MNADRTIAPVNAPKKRRPRRAPKESSKEKKVRILFVASEGLPYSKTGGLADVVEGLPRALVALGHEVAVLLPRYHGNKVASVLISSVSTALGDKMRFPAIVEAAPVKGVRYFLVDDPPYFDRPQLYGD